MNKQELNDAILHFYDAIYGGAITLDGSVYNLHDWIEHYSPFVHTMMKKHAALIPLLEGIDNLKTASLKLTRFRESDDKYDEAFWECVTEISKAHMLTTQIKQIMESG